jgi:hypothetical protein
MALVHGGNDKKDKRISEVNFLFREQSRRLEKLSDISILLVLSASVYLPSLSLPSPFLPLLFLKLCLIHLFLLCLISCLSLSFTAVGSCKNCARLLASFFCALCFVLFFFGLSFFVFGFRFSLLSKSHSRGCLYSRLLCFEIGIVVWLIFSSCVVRFHRVVVRFACPPLSSSLLHLIFPMHGGRVMAVTNMLKRPSHHPHPRPYLQDQ